MNTLNRNYKTLSDDLNYNQEDKSTQMFEPSDFKHSEYELDEVSEAEVINVNCVYFGETVWVTHKAYSSDIPWYKAELGYYIGESSDSQVWFKEDEIEFI